jgi:glyoxylase-like metal-dependent hydrolase (beta-lactamase superfamily II)
MQNRLVIPLVFLVLLGVQAGCSNGQAGAPVESPPLLSIQTYVSGAPSGSSAHLILGSSEAMLVDAAMTPDDAQQIIKMIESAGLPLTSIFVTHGHPDHIGGLETVSSRFPEARIVSTAPVAEALQAQGRNVETLETSLITLDEVQIEVLAIPGGESEASAGLYIPSLDALISGDVIYSQTHPFLGNEDIDRWRQQLDNLETMDLARIYPGHGYPAAPAVFDSLRTYFDVFLEAVATGDRQTAESRIRARYPGYAGDNLLNFSLSTYLASDPE